MHLTDLQLYKEDDKYYLCAKFLHEDKGGVHEVSIPKIEFPVSPNCDVSFNSGWNDVNTPFRFIAVDFGFVNTLFYAKPFNDEGHLFTMTCLEEKVHEMTLAEIEKALGYKIKLKEN